jgi:outer membrane protein TolC
MDLIQLVQDADAALLDVERARLNVEAAKYALEMAKTDFDQAKSAFDAVIARADDVGVPRAKLKKIVEERTAVLSASGLLSVPANRPSITAKPAKPAKKNAKAKAAEKDSSEVKLDEDLSADADSDLAPMDV